MDKDAEIRALKEELGVIRKAYTIAILMRPKGRKACGQEAEEWEETCPIEEVYNLIGRQYKADRERGDDEKIESEDAEDIRMRTNNL